MKMLIKKQEEITEKLSEAVLNATGQDIKGAVESYGYWLNVLSNIEKNESETRLKQNIHDDELTNRLEDLEMQERKDEKELNRQLEKEKREEADKKMQNIIDNAVKIGTTAFTALTSLSMLDFIKKTVNSELGGDPLFGWPKYVQQLLTRTVFGFKMK